MGKGRKGEEKETWRIMELYFGNPRYIFNVEIPNVYGKIKNKKNIKSKIIHKIIKCEILQKKIKRKKNK